MKKIRCLVDSWTICIASKNHLLKNWNANIKKWNKNIIHIEKSWEYKLTIKNTWNWDIVKYINFPEWEVYVWDPCYIIKDTLWDTFCDDVIEYGNEYIEIIDEMWWDWDYVVSIVN